MINGDDICEWLALSIGRDLGYDALYDYCKDRLGCDDFEDQASIPIGYNRIVNRFPGQIVLSKETDDYITNKVKKYTDQGLEVPYFMLGRYVNEDGEIKVLIDKVIDLFDESKANNQNATFSSEMINIIRLWLLLPEYNFAVMGHSHPHLSSNGEIEDPKYNALYTYLRNVKGENDFRDGNLNMTLMDIYSLLVFSIEMKRAKKESMIMGSIYHDNGELNFTYLDSEYNIGMATNIYRNLDDGSLEPVDNFDIFGKEKVR